MLEVDLEGDGPNGREEYFLHINLRFTCLETLVAPLNLLRVLQLGRKTKGNEKSRDKDELYTVSVFSHIPSYIRAASAGLSQSLPPGWAVPFSNHKEPNK